MATTKKQQQNAAQQPDEVVCQACALYREHVEREKRKLAAEGYERYRKVYHTKFGGVWTKSTGQIMVKIVLPAREKGRAGKFDIDAAYVSDFLENNIDQLG